VQNLKAAVPLLTGLLVRPGETFSFCKTIGQPTRARGFTDGMELSHGVARAGVGGGLCQLSNLLHWLVLHSPLTVVERHHHSFDPFPDDGRVLPFGSGATVFFNYRDFRFRNDCSCGSGSQTSCWRASCARRSPSPTRIACSSAITASFARQGGPGARTSYGGRPAGKPTAHHW